MEKISFSAARLQLFDSTTFFNRLVGTFIGPVNLELSKCCWIPIFAKYSAGLPTWTTILGVSVGQHDLGLRWGRKAKKRRWKSSYIRKSCKEGVLSDWLSNFARLEIILDRIWLVRLGSYLSIAQSFQFRDGLCWLFLWIGALVWIAGQVWVSELVWPVE